MISCVIVCRYATISRERVEETLAQDPDQVTPEMLEAEKYHDDWNGLFGNITDILPLKLIEATALSFGKASLGS